MQQSRNATPRRPETGPAARRASSSADSRRSSNGSASSANGASAGSSSSSTTSSIGSVFRGSLDATVPGWIFGPLRLFLGVTFVYAGIQKLTDPQFFNPHAIGYIGNQIKAFAVGSPINGLLMHVVLPHVQFWGAAIAWGEIAIGLGALLGLLLRPAAFFGALLSLLFFLSASWRVHPYFYGADIVFVFAWMTLLLAGPLAGGWPAVDLWLAEWLERRVPPQRLASVRAALALVIGVPMADEVAVAEGSADGAAAPASIRGRGGVRAAQRARQAQAEMGRRQFVRGVVVGGSVMLVVSWLWSVTHPAAATTTEAGATSATAAVSTPGSGSAAGASNVIAQVSSVPANSSATFTIPSNGDPGVLVHLQTGKFVAFDATCTHQGCPVSYDPSSQLLLCPCHGAAFDPAQNAAVVQGPADTPLAPVSVSVDQSSGSITLN
ncbi:MAG TPA: TQO small subunit DoxD [Ktedonobacterales bacterium]|nr:TQO small subunit DoxD [Ktedonobacterales bacterium]